jgi:hypothetical protein
MNKIQSYKACPDENELALFIEGKLKGQHYLLIKKHIETCGLCNETVRLALELSAVDMEMVMGQEIKVANKRAAKAGRNLCVVFAEHYILQVRNCPVDLDSLVSTAIHRKWLGRKGIKFKNIGKILELFEVEVDRRMNGTLADIEKALAKGYQVIVGVDAGELFPGTGLKKFKEKVEDLFEQRPDHALIVTAVNKDKKGREIELLNIENNKPVHYSLPRNQFMDAWKDSGYYWVVIKNTDAHNKY